VEPASRLIVIASTVLAAVTHAWLVDEHSSLAVAAGLAFLVMLALARVSLPAALTVVIGTTFMAPALLAAAFAVTDYQQTIVWLAAFAGVLVAHADWRRWSVPPHWTTPLATWAVIIAVTWPIVAAREVDFSVIAARTVDTTIPLTEALPRVAAGFVVIVALSQLVGLLWIDLLWARFAGRPRELTRAVVVPLLGGAVVGALVGIYQRFVDFSWMNLPIWSNAQRAGGLMLDANAFGTGAALLAPTAVALACSSGQRRWWPWLTFVILAAGMWATGSRTALLIFMSGTVALALASLRQRGLWRPRVGRLATAAALLAFVVAAAVVPRDFVSSNPLQRAFARVPRFERAEIARFATELWDRFGYGRAAHQMISEHPVSGVGTGAFPLLAPEYIYRDRGGVFGSDNAQNWWRQQLAELGVLGAVPAIWCSGLVLLLCWPKQHEKDARMTVLRGSLIGLGVASLVGVPTQGAAILITFGTLLFALADGAKEPPPKHGATAMLYVGGLLVAVVATSVMFASSGDLRVPNRALRSGVPYAYGWTPPQEVSRFGEVRWMAMQAVTVVPKPQSWLRVTIWAPYSDLSARPIQFELRTNGRTRIAHDIAVAGPVSFAIEFEEPAVLEMRASRELMPNRSLQIAMSWHPDVPDGIDTDHVVRSGHALR
jgi:O-antigen ligase